MKTQIEELLAGLERQRAEGLYPNIDRATAEYLYSKIIESGAKNIVELGGCNGYSTIWLALAARKTAGTVITFEWSRPRCEALRENIKSSGFEDIVTIHESDAKLGIPNISGEIDFVFIDATKHEHLDYVKLLEKKLHPGSVIVTDNIISHRDKLLDFLEYVKNNRNFESEEVDLGSGILIATYKPR